MGWKRKTPEQRSEEAVLQTRWSDIKGAAERIRAEADPVAIDRGLAFLHADPKYHGSGYQKEVLWRRLTRAPLSRKQRAQLEDAALALLGRRLTREFWTMARAMSRVGTASFWDDVRRSTVAGDRAVRRRAAALSAYERGIAPGEAARYALRYDR
jgi:hypothetical protein